MLIIENGGNWEKSRRTSTIPPEAHYAGGTAFLPVNIVPTKVHVPSEDSSGEDPVYVEVDGYIYDEYRINRAVNLPEDAVAALLSAYIEATHALGILGVSK